MTLLSTIVAFLITLVGVRVFDFFPRDEATAPRGAE